MNYDLSTYNFASNTRKFARALLSGKKLTTKQAQSTYRIPNPSATVFRLKNDFNIPISMENGKYSISA